MFSAWRRVDRNVRRVAENHGFDGDWRLFSITENNCKISWYCIIVRALYFVFIIPVNILQSYKQERGCLMHFVRPANTLLKDEESARHNHVLVCNFAKYLPILFFLLADSAINLS